MNENLEKRYFVLVDQQPPTGGLYELEQITRFLVIDKFQEKILLNFTGKMSASLDRDTGLWGECSYEGASDVNLSDDDSSVVVNWHDGSESTFCLPPYSELS